MLFNLASQTCSGDRVVFLLTLPAFDAAEEKKRRKQKKNQTTEPKGS